MHNAIQEMEVKYEVQQREQAHQAERERDRTQRLMLTVGLIAAILLLALLALVVVLHRKRNRALAETNVTKDKFFSIISHDLKNPAVAQRNAIQFLVDNAGSWDTPSLTRYYHSLLKSADNQVSLIFTLLDWAQMQAERMPYHPAQFELADALHSDIGIIKNMAEKKGVAFDVLIPETALVSADRDMITTVVRNLLTNAVKFTPEGGTVTLKASPNPSEGGGFSPPSGELEGAYIVSVTDTGIGMSEAQISNLFHLDKQQSRRGTDGEEGSGLGLIVCKELLKKHGSELHVESEEGKGSKFWFELKIEN